MQRANDIPIIGLFKMSFDLVEEELFSRVRAAGYADIRAAHGCVFGGITPEGSRLTELADIANMTKQAVGEVVSELEQIGYVERVPDPNDGRAKIIKLTERGEGAWRLGFEIMGEIEERWAKRYGKQRVRDMMAVLREMLDDERAAGAERAVA